MLEKNKADSRKYFIFKIRDLVHNSFHTLEEKRTESLLQYMGICISTYDELRASLDPTKLKRSYEGLLEGLDYQMQIHPFHKLDLYQNDFSHLHQLGASTLARNKNYYKPQKCGLFYVKFYLFLCCTELYFIFICDIMRYETQL